MKQRHVTMPMLMEVLTRGVMARPPETEVRHTRLRCRMQRFVAGVNVAAVVHVEYPAPDLVVDGQSVARWEKTSKVPRWADKLARLLYVAHAEGNVPIGRAVERIQTVARLTNQRIVVEELDGRWRPRVDDAAEGKELTAA